MIETVDVMYLDILDRTVEIIECNKTKKALNEILHAKQIKEMYVSIEGNKYSVALISDDEELLPSIVNDHGEIIAYGDLVVYAGNSARLGDIDGLDKDDFNRITRHINPIRMVDSDSDFEMTYSVIEIDSPEENIPYIS